MECHQGSDPSGGLSLTTRAGLRKGGDSGSVLDPQSPRESYLLERVESGEMPPEKQGHPQKLSDSEIAVLRNWIVSGAVWPAQRKLDFFEQTSDTRAGRDWWSLQPVVRPDVPQYRESQQKSEIDAFVRHRLSTSWYAVQHLESQSSRSTSPSCISCSRGHPRRRMKSTRLLPIQATAAWERAVDRLLDSPQYGVRWARHWLDLVRYADTCGYERDQEKPFAWKYRDWVVDALNKDLPYDDFVTQQLAGDEMPDRDETTVIATGFLRLGTWNDEPNDPADYVYDRLEDLVHTTSTAFLGMTVKCARCHGHKFDPITQEDYYRMASIFWAGASRSRCRIGWANEGRTRCSECTGLD